MIDFKSDAEVLPTRWRLEPVDAPRDIGSGAANVDATSASERAELLCGRFGACGAWLLGCWLLAVSGVALLELPRDFLAVPGVVALGFSDMWPEATSAVS